MAAAPLVVLAGFFTGFGLRVIVVGLTIIGIGLLMSVVYGAVEHPARERAPKRSIIDSWTEKDARTSGL
jgi:Zn-dependent membrane protease YugP